MGERSDREGSPSGVSPRTGGRVGAPWDGLRALNYASNTPSLPTGSGSPDKGPRPVQWGPLSGYPSRHPQSLCRLPGLRAVGLP